ncbi:MAG: hypothetical protein KKE86_16855 [Planctomycetes bacterium]|nr:hypothetical protein [Planctomycetota bacterium]
MTNWDGGVSAVVGAGQCSFQPGNELEERCLSLANINGIFPKRNSCIGYISGLAVLTTMFAGFSFIGNSLIGLFFALIVIVLSFEKIKISPLQLISVLLLSIYCAVVLFFALDEYIVLQNIRYWFGFTVYVFFFMARPDNRLISFGFVRFLCVSVLVESLLVNTLVSSELLHSGSNEIGIVFAGWYERPLSFAGNPGTSGIALLSLFFLVERLLKTNATKFDLFLLFVAIAVLVSTTAMIGFIFLLVLRLFTGSSKISERLSLRNSLLPLVLVVFIGCVYFNVDVEYIQKFSVDYISYIYNLKFFQISEYSNDGLLDFLIGSQVYDLTPKTSGDFGWLVFLNAMGLFGVALYLFSLFSFYRSGKVLFPVLVLMLVGSTHYPSAMSPAGQLIIAMTLTLGPLYLHEFKTLKSRCSVDLG